ncbi:MAG TPA: hypothetical protein VE631_08590 [Alphaproteobacteria bacterium]|jgi:hypothetical protein|nr:hypothetical protein [Alphaproteobacteria bacterium]
MNRRPQQLPRRRVVVLDRENARQGETGQGMRYVLVWSTGLTALALLSLAAAFVF